jgi:hypothetical protein
MFHTDWFERISISPRLPTPGSDALYILRLIMARTRLPVIRCFTFSMVAGRMKQVGPFSEKLISFLTYSLISVGLVAHRTIPVRLPLIRQHSRMGNSKMEKRLTSRLSSSGLALVQKSLIRSQAQLEHSGICSTKWVSNMYFTNQRAQLMNGSHGAEHLMILFQDYLDNI